MSGMREERPSPRRLQTLQEFCAGEDVESLPSERYGKARALMNKGAELGSTLEQQKQERDKKSNRKPSKESGGI